MEKAGEREEEEEEEEEVQKEKKDERNSSEFINVEIKRFTGLEITRGFL